MKKIIIVCIISLLFSFNLIYGGDSRSNPVTATYCDGSKVDIYPYSFVTRDDGATFNCYEAQAEPYGDGMKYMFEDSTDGDYNDIVIKLSVSGNKTQSPVVNVKYLSKDADYKHWIYIVYNGTQQLVFRAEEQAPGATFTIPLPVKYCADFAFSAAPASQTVSQGESAQYNISLTALWQFDSPVQFSVRGLPTGASAAFSANPITASPTAETILEVTTGADIPAGTYPLFIVGEGGGKNHTKEITLIINKKDEEPEADFTMEVEPGTQTVFQGESVDYTINLTALNGFSKRVTLGIRGLPDGATAVYDPKKVLPTGEAKLTVTTSQTIPTGTYTLKLDGKGGGKHKRVDVTLTVEEKPPDPDFTLSATPAERTVPREESAEYTVKVNGINDFSGEVTLAADGLPAGTTVQFTPAALGDGQEATLLITTSADTPTGSHSFTVTGTSGELTHSVTLTLSLTCPGFSIGISAEPTSGSAPLTVQFTGEITPGASFELSNYTFAWDFGDNTTAAEQNPEHTYLAPGIYQAVFTVTGPCGKTKTASVSIEAEGFEGALTKSFSTAEALPGDQVTVTIQARNDTRFDFTNITIEDQLSSLLEYIEDDASVQSQRSGQDLTWQFPTLKKGETITINIKVKVFEDADPGTITNIAYLSHGSLEQGERIASNTASLTIDKIDVILRKQVEQTSVEPGDTVKYQITMKNNSSVPLTGVKLSDELSNHLEFISQTGQLGFSRQGAQLLWTGTLEPRQQEVIFLEARVGQNTFSGTRIENTAKLEAAELKEPITSDTTVTTVSSEPISSTTIQFNIRSDVPQTEVGRIIRYSITTRNSSLSTVLSPVIEVHLPQGFSYVAASSLLNGQRFTEPPGRRRLVWQLPAINGGETVVLRYQAVIGTDAARGRNITRASLRAVDNSGQDLFYEDSAFVNVSTAGFIFYSGVEGTVYLDRDGDEFYSMTDTPLENIEVRMSTGEKAVTDPMGHYSFENLFPGEYAVGVNRATLPEKYRVAIPVPKVVALSDGLTDTADFAIKFQGEDDEKNARLEGRVFYDKIRNMAYDPGDRRAMRFKAKLDGGMITTGSNGTFVFTHLKPGPHTVEIIYGRKTYRKEIILQKGKQLIDFPLPYSAIRIIIKGEDQ